MMNRLGNPCVCRPRKVLVPSVCHFSRNERPSRPDDHVERRRRHPLEAGRVDQHVERVLDAVVDDATLVDLAHAHGGGVDEVHVRQVERRQVLVVEGRAACSRRGSTASAPRRSSGSVDDGVDPGADLLHDAEVRVELLLDQLLGGQPALVLLALLEVGDLAGEVVVVGLDRGAALGDLGEAGAPGARPAGLLRPGVSSPPPWSRAGRARRWTTACAGRRRARRPSWPARGSPARLSRRCR